MKPPGLRTDEAAIRGTFFKTAYCSVALEILDDVIAGPHPCRTIVRSQPIPPELFQLPEPWVGHIETAPLLFVSSKPSIGDDKHATRSSSSEQVWDSHVNLFDPRAGYTKDGIYTVLSNGARNSRWVPRSIGKDRIDPVLRI